MDTHNLKCDFGRHKDELYTRIPVSYLKWMFNSNHSKADIAKAELERRGTVTPKLEISGHAVDSASLRLRKIWHETSKENEGLNAWLIRISEDALKNGIQKEDKIIHKGIKFIFEKDGCWPVLKTIMLN